MTDATDLPSITAPKLWRFTMADKTTRMVEARGFRIEGGALVLNLPAGCAAAYAPGIWVTIEHECGGSHEQV